MNAAGWRNFESSFASRDAIAVLRADSISPALGDSPVVLLGLRAELKF